MPITTCIFDAYGTLFDVTAAARQTAAEKGHEALATVWSQVAKDWRLKQLQYTWLRAVMKAHTDFWTVTQNGLDYALKANGLADNLELRERLLTLYWELEAYAEVPEMLKALKEIGLNTAILSNGSPDMLGGAVQSAAISDVLDDVLSVESVGVLSQMTACIRWFVTGFIAHIQRFYLSLQTGGMQPQPQNSDFKQFGSIVQTKHQTNCLGDLNSR